MGYGKLWKTCQKAPYFHEVAVGHGGSFENAAVGLLRSYRGIVEATAILFLAFAGCQANPSPAYAAEGYATYYTVKSCQREGTSGVYTASGERFQENRLTCALPHHHFGKYYRITSLKTGKSVIVRHNDFGPGRGSQRHGTIIDLTPAAFSALGHKLSEGKIQVSVTGVAS